MEVKHFYSINRFYFNSTKQSHPSSIKYLFYFKLFIYMNCLLFLYINFIKLVNVIL